jgi:hypothetical protein
MKLSLLLPALLLGLVVSPRTQAQDDGPRQLGAPPSVPTVPPRPAGRQAEAAPQSTPDTVRRAVAPGSANLPTPVYAPTPAGQLPGSNSRATRYQVGLKSGLVYSANDVEVKSPLFGHTYLLLDGQRKLEFSEVGFYEDETGHYVRTTLPGASRESTLRRDKTGRLSLYSITSTQYSSSPYGMGAGYGYGRMGYGGLPYGGYRTVKTEYFSKDNGPIQNMSLKNLALATSDHPGAQQLLADSRRYQRLSIASYVAGGGLLLAGLLQTVRTSENQATSISPLLYAALPILIVPIVLQSKQASNQRQAISLYNSAP